jgi:hypothetical protein
MRLCRYRWDNFDKKLTLITDITRPLAPVALLRALSQLKTVNEVYGPNRVTTCPMSLGAADVVILREAKRWESMVVEVQRDRCRGVLITHVDFRRYAAYLFSASLLAQLDAIKAVARSSQPGRIAT